ncbi:hypothetical protein [uncultured Desulfovibrio sp.]|uniref:Uncharacterized protein n=1 Tax=Candidatus Desulfovibrio intestinavium TaxID=2838534 RepID=A0A9D2HM98_9BACT|nr:hypothetical protein [uncultured Desulfovibrio sp.]HJA79566.1 hypothetical protein [Candidatus Desulfovibrio intestinavium]
MPRPSVPHSPLAVLLALAYAAAAVLLLLLARGALDGASTHEAARGSLFLALVLLLPSRRIVVAHAAFFALFALFLPVVAAEWHTHTHSLASPDLTDFIDFLFHPPQTTTELHEFLWSLLIMAPLVLFALLCFHAVLHGALRAVRRRLGER